MDPAGFIDPNLTGPDVLVLKQLLDDAQQSDHQPPETSLRRRQKDETRM
jgi:hypothetical protein